MSRQLIQQYYSKVDKVIQYGGVKNETAIRGAFHDLLNQYAEKRNLLVVEGCPVQGTEGRNVIPDGVLKNAFRLDLGIWESKDEADTLDDEIDKKHKKGYPFYNALFEDSRTAVLFQYGEKVASANIREPDELDKLLHSFLDYRNEYIVDFEKALEQFREHYNPSVIARNEAEKNSARMTKQSPPSKSSSKSRGIASKSSAQAQRSFSRNDARGEAITKESIFHYCYAVLHNPTYRKKYELNLKA